MFLSIICRFQNRGSLKLRQDIAMNPEQNLVILEIIMIRMIIRDNCNDDDKDLPDVSAWSDPGWKL